MDSNAARRISVLAAGLVVACLQAPVNAQKYPTKPVRVIVPFTAGSQTDLNARLVGAKLAEAWGQQVVVDNRGGAGGTLGTAIVADSNPDGYTLLIHSSGYAIAPALYPKWKVDMLRDFQAITTLVSASHLMLISPTLGPKSVKEFIDFARKRGDGFVWASAGVGSGTHFNGEMFMMATGLKHVHVPYKGTPEAMVDTISGRVHVFFGPIGPAMPLIKDGRALALAVTSKNRSPVLPNLPTLAESGLPGFDFSIWFVAAAPAKTPKPVIQAISSEMLKILAMPDIVKAFAAQGAVPEPRSPEEAQKFIAGQIRTLGEVARAANVPTQ